jgi:hypothetical protein
MNTNILSNNMACERVTAFNLYLLDVIDLIKKNGMTSDEIYETAQKEWREMSKELTFYYIQKEACLNMNKNRNDNHIISRIDNISNYINSILL